MTLVILPKRPKAGDAEVVADIIQDLDAILTVLNGDLRNDNISANAAIALTKLVTGSDGQFLRMVGSTPTWYTNPSVKLTRNANQSINHATFTAQNFGAGTEDTDPTGMHDTGSNTSRITIATAGYYLIGGEAWYASAAGAIRQNDIRINGTATTVATHNGATVGAGNNTIVNIVGGFLAAAADYIELFTYQDSGGAINVVFSRFWAVRVA